MISYPFTHLYKTRSQVVLTLFNVLCIQNLSGATHINKFFVEESNFLQSSFFSNVQDVSGDSFITPFFGYQLKVAEITKAHPRWSYTNTMNSKGDFNLAPSDQRTVFSIIALKKNDETEWRRSGIGGATYAVNKEQYNRKDLQKVSFFIPNQISLYTIHELYAAAYFNTDQQFQSPTKEYYEEKGFRFARDEMKQIFDPLPTHMFMTMVKDLSTGTEKAVFDLLNSSASRRKRHIRPTTFMGSLIADWIFSGTGSIDSLKCALNEPSHLANVAIQSVAVALLSPKALFAIALGVVFAIVTFSFFFNLFHSLIDYIRDALLEPSAFIDTSLHWLQTTWVGSWIFSIIVKPMLHFIMEEESEEERKERIEAMYAHDKLYFNDRDERTVNAAIQKIRFIVKERMEAANAGRKLPDMNGHILFSGPPGTGKSSLLKKIAAMLMVDGNVEIVRITSDTVRGSNRLEEQIAQAQKAVEFGKTLIILYDEMESSMKSHTGKNVNETSQREAVRFLRILDPPQSSNEIKPILIGTTNLTFELNEEGGQVELESDDAFVDRLTIVPISKPEKSQVLNILNSNIVDLEQNSNVYFTEESKELLYHAVNNFSLHSLENGRQIRATIKDTIYPVAKMNTEEGNQVIVTEEMVEGVLLQDKGYQPQIAKKNKI